MTDTTCGDGISEYRLLLTFEEVIRELGGVVKVAVLTGRSKSAVCNWRNTGARFPANTYRRIKGALQKRGCIADLNLFTFLPVRITETPIVDVAA